MSIGSWHPSFSESSNADAPAGGRRKRIISTTSTSAGTVSQARKPGDLRRRYKHTLYNNRLGVRRWANRETIYVFSETAEQSCFSYIFVSTHTRNQDITLLSLDNMLLALLFNAAVALVASDLSDGPVILHQ